MLRETHNKFVAEMRAQSLRPFNAKRRKDTIALYARYIAAMKAELATMPPEMAAAQGWRAEAIKLSEDLLAAMKHGDKKEIARIDAIMRDGGGVSLL